MNETNLAKIAITTTADEALSAALTRVNQGFKGGRITKTDMASWLVLQGAGALDESSIEEVRRAHFNQVVYLESLVKKLKSTGRDSLATEDLAALQAILGQQTTKKRQRPSKMIDGAQENSEQ